MKAGVATPASGGVPRAGSVLLVSTLLISIVASLANPQYGSVPGLTPFNTAIKLIDPAFVVLLASVATAGWLRRGREATPTWKVLSIGSGSLLVAVGCLAALLWQAPPYLAGQSLYFVCRPALILVVLCSWPGWPTNRVWPPVLVFGVANALTALGQSSALARVGRYNDADAIIGLLNDAHQQATFSYTLALLLIGMRHDRSSVLFRAGRQALIVLCLIAGFASQGQKATGALVVILLMAATLRVFQSRRRIRRVLAVAPPAIAAILIVSSLAAGAVLWHAMSLAVAGNLSDRLTRGRYRGVDFIGDIGAVGMIDDFITVSRGEPLTVLVGLGPASFGSPAALTRFAAGDVPPRLKEVFFRETMNETQLAGAGELRLLGLSAKTGVFGVVLGEYGAIGLLCFLCATALPFFARARTAEGARFLFWLKWAYAAVVVQSMLSTLGAWDNDVVMTVLMVGFAGHLSPESGT